MKTIKLEGALLDYWVARVQQSDAEIVDGKCQCIYGAKQYFQPSLNWLDAGPIIEREHFYLE
jgi:hypothetical protein